MMMRMFERLQRYTRKTRNTIPFLSFVLVPVTHFVSFPLKFFVVPLKSVKEKKMTG